MDTVARSERYPEKGGSDVRCLDDFLHSERINVGEGQLGKRKKGGEQEEDIAKIMDRFLLLASSERKQGTSQKHRKDEQEEVDIAYVSGERGLWSVEFPVIIFSLPCLQPYCVEEGVVERSVQFEERTISDTHDVCNVVESICVTKCTQSFKISFKMHTHICGEEFPFLKVVAPDVDWRDKDGC